MAVSAWARALPKAVLVAAVLWLHGASAQTHLLPWEVTVAEIETGRLRYLSERLSKQYILYQLRLGVSKPDLNETAAQIDETLANLERGNPSRSIPAPWTPDLRERVASVDRSWAPLRRIATASPYDHLRVAREFMKPEVRRGDPLLIRYFDELSALMITEVELLIATYHARCLETGLEICPTAQTSGYAAMIIERAIKQAVFVVAGIDAAANRERMTESLVAYQAVRDANDTSEFFAAALDPQRGASAAAAGQLLASLRSDWDAMQQQFAILAAGDEENFDLEQLLLIQTRMVEKIERLTAALIRYANVTYGS
jgi:hypothetical protein